jgi:hypothetical protein
VEKNCRSGKSARNSLARGYGISHVTMKTVSHIAEYIVHFVEIKLCQIMKKDLEMVSNLSNSRFCAREGISIARKVHDVNE